MSLSVSIITPSYNQGRFIEQCLLSIKNQTYKNIEHIVLDNCSQDNTVEILIQYRGKYNLRWISEPDTGQASAINKGFALAKGDIICWLNTDDYYFNDQVIEKVVNIFMQNPFVDVVIGDGYIANEGGKLVKPNILISQGLNAGKMRYCDYILQPSAFWRRNNVKLDETYNYVFDWHFFYIMYKKQLNFYYFREFLSVYRIYSDNKTSLDNYNRKKEVFHVVRGTLGPYNLNTIWCYIVFILYYISDKSNLKFIKQITILLNQILSSLTKRRIYSC